MDRYRLSSKVGMVAGLGVTAAAVTWFAGAGRPLAQALLFVCPGLAFTGMLLLGSDYILERGQKSITAEPVRIALVPVFIWGLYVIFAAGMGIATASALAAMAVYLSIPFLAFTVWPKAEPLVILWIWLPLELGIVRRILI